MACLFQKTAWFTQTSTPCSLPRPPLPHPLDVIDSQNANHHSQQNLRVSQLPWIPPLPLMWSWIHPRTGLYALANTLGSNSQGVPPRTSNETILQGFSDSVYGVSDFFVTSIRIAWRHLGIRQRKRTTLCKCTNSCIPPSHPESQPPPPQKHRGDWDLRSGNECTQFSSARRCYPTQKSIPRFLVQLSILD